MTPDSRAWRRALLALCGLTIALVAAGVANVVAYGTAGFTFAALDRPFTVRVKAVDPHSYAAGASLRAGDRIDFGALPAADRYWLALQNPHRAGYEFSLPTERDGRRFETRLRVTPHPEVWHNWDYLVGVAGGVWIVLFASAIGLRRPDSPEARLLALVLIFCVVLVEFAGPNTTTPWPAVNFGANLLNCVLFPSVYALVAAYALLFGRPPSRLRRAMTALTYASAAAYMIWTALPLVGAWTGTIDPNARVFTSLAWNLLTPLWPLIACVILAMRDSHGVERTRLSWAAGPLILALTAQFLAQYLGNMAGTTPSRLPVVIYNISLFVLPLGLTYSLLSRRLLDIGFALNRATIFAATSLLLAGLFAGLQWAANAALSDLSHAHNAVVQIGIAIIVYYVVRLSRHQTDQFVGRVFFAKRHARIAAIRSLARQVDDVNEADRIAPFVVQSLLTQAQLDVHVLLQRGDGSYTSASETPAALPELLREDALLIALRSQREPLAVPNWDGTAETAFPMLVRGQMRGVLLARSLDGDELAPDESAALFALAREMATARDDLLAESLRERLRFYESSLGEPQPG